MSHSWQAIFWGGEGIPLWGFFVRVTLLYWLIVLATRLMGKRQIGILTNYNYIVAAGIVAISSSRMVNPQFGLMDAMVVVAVYTCINFVISFLGLKWPSWIERGSVCLIDNGHIVKRNLRKGFITMDELMGQLRLRGIHSLSHVAYATLEASGAISIEKKAEYQPLSRKQLNLPPKNAHLPHCLVYDGEILHENLVKLGLDVPWLKNRLRQRGISDMRWVFIVLLEDDGNLTVSLGE